jgi:uncharacterized membrane protein
MVLELKVPEGADLHALRPILPLFLAYLLSFVVVGIYWNNHHHMLHATDRINGRVLWANLHLLFWLSLVPAATAWLGETDSAPVPTAVYGVILLAAAIAYKVLQTTIIRQQGAHAKLTIAIGSDLKGIGSMGLYAAALPIALVSPWIADAIYVAVVLMWLVPDRRIEAIMNREADQTF